MSEDVLQLIKQNVIQGRKNKDDEGIDANLSGKPGVIELTQLAIKQGISPELIITQGLTSGMLVAGEKFERKEYYIFDIIVSAEAVAAAMDILEPHLEFSGIRKEGKFVIATVKGDIHDVGKNIVAILLKGAGYEVKDLGVDVPTEMILEVVKEYEPDYLGLSALLTTTMVAMEDVIEALEQNGLREKVKVLIGGTSVSDEYALEIGADAYCADGFQAIKLLKTYKRSGEHPQLCN